MIDEAQPQDDGQKQDIKHWVDEIEEADWRGDYIRAFDLAQKSVLEHAGDAELRYREILALLNAGGHRRAEEAYRHWFTDDGKFAETCTGSLRTSLQRDVASLPARIAKDNAFAHMGTSDQGWMLELAARRYERVYYLSEGDFFPGINAATLWFLAKRADHATTIAKEVLHTCAHLEALQEPKETEARKQPLPDDDLSAVESRSRAESQSFYVAASEAEAQLAP
jgi:hypothetical protein